MAGVGRAPKPATTRRNGSKPRRGEWKPAPGIGWQHGPVPTPRGELQPATLAAWRTWFEAWYAAHWTPDDLPALEVVADLYDRVVRGTASMSTFGELRRWMAELGISIKGQQDRRWTRFGPAPAAPGDVQDPVASPASPYRGLRVQ